jgi:hypothetical protein
MNPSDFRVRRATLDDIGALRALWESMRYPTGDLERRLTEFQVVEGPGGEVVGALGFQIIERQARIHSEAFTDFAIADSMRPVFLKRIQSLAMNHGPPSVDAGACAVLDAPRISVRRTAALEKLCRLGSQRSGLVGFHQR